MLYKYTIKTNNYLKSEVKGYYHQFYVGHLKPGNPDFLNTLKNQFNTGNLQELILARDIVIDILIEDIPRIISEEQINDCTLVCVPRAKSYKSYTVNQLLFKEAIGLSTTKLKNVKDGSDFIRRIINTFTTHLRYATHIENDGKKPYPGITKDTCSIQYDQIQNQNIILIDDIYTANVNIDEDCIQWLIDCGARKVIFYSIGLTRR